MTITIVFRIMWGGQ